MQNRVFHFALIFLTLITIIGLLHSSAAFAGQDKAAIEKVRMNFNTAFNAGDAKAMARLIDRDGVWMPPGETALVGKENIAARYTAHFAEARSTFELKPGEIQLCGKWAFMSGAFSRADMPKAGGIAKQVSGHYFFVLKKQSDGSWRISRDIWNEAVVKP
jgi:uncharacterized protein (TIGR02246 family)